LAEEVWVVGEEERAHGVPVATGAMGRREVRERGVCESGYMGGGHQRSRRRQAAICKVQ
jgi:hypothetical protein